MKNVCPKCKKPYGGKRFKTDHHIIPRKLWVKREKFDPRIRELLMDFTIEICRVCHDELNEFIDMAERELLYAEHQALYIKVLTTFLGGNHAIPPHPVPPPGGGNDTRWCYGLSTRFPLPGPSHPDKEK